MNFSLVNVEAPAWSHDRTSGIFNTITDTHTILVLHTPNQHKYRRISQMTYQPESVGKMADFET